MSEDHKQQLESQLWNIANTLRGKMGADDFRDYILGFIFYKYLSERMHLFADEILKHDGITFDAIDETQALTNVKHFEEGTLVNVERSAKQNAEVGGHVLSGHIVGTATVADIERDENRCRMTFSAPNPWLKYVFEKGYVAVNGASLTVAALDRENATFAINLIPETLERTNFSRLAVDDPVNIEVESQTQVIVDTVERVMAERLERNG